MTMRWLANRCGFLEKILEKRKISLEENNKMANLPIKLQSVTLAGTKALVEKYIANGKVLDDEFGKWILSMAYWQARRMKLKLPPSDYEDCVMAGVFNCIKYGLKNIEQKQLERIYYYLASACTSGMCRWLERHNRYKKRYAVTDDPYLLAEEANEKDGEVKTPIGEY